MFNRPRFGSSWRRYLLLEWTSKPNMSTLPGPAPPADMIPTSPFRIGPGKCHGVMNLMCVEHRRNLQIQISSNPQDDPNRVLQ